MSEYEIVEIIGVHGETLYKLIYNGNDIFIDSDRFAVVEHKEYYKTQIMIVSLRQQLKAAEGKIAELEASIDEAYADLIHAFTCHTKGQQSINPWSYVRDAIITLRIKPMEIEL